MNEFRQFQEGVEHQRRGKAQDYSCELPCIIDRLSALGRMLWAFCEIDESLDILSGKELSGIGLLLEDIVDRLKEVNAGLYGD